MDQHYNLTLEEMERGHGHSKSSGTGTQEVPAAMLYSHTSRIRLRPHSGEIVVQDVLLDHMLQARTPTTLRVDNNSLTGKSHPQLLHQMVQANFWLLLMLSIYHLKNKQNRCSTCIVNTSVCGGDLRDDLQGHSEETSRCTNVT